MKIYLWTLVVLLICDLLSVWSRVAKDNWEVDRKLYGLERLIIAGMLAWTAIHLSRLYE